MIQDYGYIEKAIANIKEVAEKQEKNILAAAKLMADAIAADKLINVYAGGGHTTLAMGESLDRLNAVEKVCNPNFARVLVDNATCRYCASHHYESAEYWYKPAICAFADDFVRRVQTNDRTKPSPCKSFDELRQEYIFARELEAMRPALPRTQENYVRTLKRMAEGL